MNATTYQNSFNGLFDARLVEQPDVIISKILHRPFRHSVYETITYKRAPEPPFTPGVSIWKGFYFVASGDAQLEVLASPYFEQFKGDE